MPLLKGSPSNTILVSGLFQGPDFCDTVGCPYAPDASQLPLPEFPTKLLLYFEL
jgi:hypothetical protein